MRGNLINRHDLVHLVTMLRRGGWRQVLRRFRRTGKQRIQDAWASPAEASDQWWVIDAVRERWARMIMGTTEDDFPAHVVREHLVGQSGLRALSVGCGTGHRPIRWAHTGAFQRIDAFDVSPPLIETASHAAAEQKLHAIVNFKVGDMHRVDLPEEGYDVVFAEQSLHHFSRLKDVLLRTRRALKRGGLLVIDEYVGPNRNQWTARQLEAANALLAVLPARYRITLDGDVKTRVVRPSLLRMRLHDPSEAVESTRIMPLLHELFDVVEEKGYGGSLLHPVFARIAHNFRGQDGETRALLRLCFEAEDALLREGEVAHDFAVAVCRKR